MSPPPLLRSIVCVTLVTFALAGCSLLPKPVAASNSAKPRSVTARPSVGECWNSTVSQADNWTNWKGAAAKPCSANHSLYTYAVGTITGVTARDWTAAGSTTELSDPIATKAEKTCAAPFTSFLPDDSWNQQRIVQFFFIPSQAAWKAGARWVRCDIGVLAFGSKIVDGKFAALPAHISTFTALDRSDPKQFDYCVDSPDPASESGPLDDPDSRIADCSEDPQWVLTSKGIFTQPLGAAYPSNTVINSTLATVCSADVSKDSDHTWTAYFPQPSEWATGDREIYCWVGTLLASDGIVV